MRTAFTLIALAGIVFAQEASGAAKTQTLQDGKLSDTFWNFTFTAPELKEGFGLGGPTTLFEGGCAGDLRVTIKCHEFPTPKTSKEWKDLVKQAWTRQEKKMEELEEGDNTLLFVQESLAGFRRHHGHAFHARGVHCFEVHVEANEKTEASGDAIKKALAGFEFGEDPERMLMVYVIAKQNNKPFDDPKVLLGAGGQYMQQAQRMPEMHRLARMVFEKARKLDEEGVYTPMERWNLYELGGLSILSKPIRDGESSIEWHKKAEEIAKDQPEAGSGAAQSAYNLACAYSLAGRIDEAYGALGRAFYYDPTVVTLEHVTSDPDLDALRADARWDEFLRVKIKGEKPAEDKPADDEPAEGKPAGDKPDGE